MRSKGRSLRVAALIKEEIAKLITNGLKDPRIGFVSVMDVRMSKDLRYANVYVSLFGSESQKKSSLVGLQHAAGWMRHEVSKYLHMRVLPEIRFFPDDTLDKVYHLEEVFEEIHAKQHQQPMLHLTVAEALAILRSGGRFLLTSHQNPDGDALGSMLALRILLQHLGASQVVCVLEDPVPQIYKELPGAAEIVCTEAIEPEYDIAVIVDCGRIERIGSVADHIRPEKRMLIFDHHLESGEPGASGIIDPSYAATGEIIAELFKQAEIPLSKEAATCLYAAVATDTGCFRYSNTKPNSHRLAAELIESGIELGPLNKNFFSDITREKFELMRRAIQRVEFFKEGQIALSWLTDEDLKTTQSRPEDAENLINLWLSVNTVRIAILLKSFERGKTRASFRSDSTFDSAAFLRQFNGGGHAPAAGATLDMPLEEARTTLLNALLEEFNND